MGADVLFLDLATTMGWCEGAPGGVPRYGSQRLAPAGSSQAAVFGGLIQFLGTRFQAFKPRTVVYEAPRDPRHMGKATNINAARLLIGLCGVAEGVCYRMGIHDVREAEVGAVRKHFLPKGSPRTGAEVKRAVIKQCQLLGFDPSDDNAADAIAGWHYATAILDPRTSARSTPLFGGPQ